MGEKKTNVFNTIRDTGQLTDRIRVDITEKISDDILLDNMIEQIRNLSNNIEKNHIDFLEDFETRLSSIQELYSYDDKLMTMVKNIQHKTYTRLLEEICYKYKLTITFRDNLTLSEQYDTIACLYRFFIVNLFDNIIEYGTHVCLKSLNGIMSQYGDSVDTKNPLYVTYSNKYNNDIASIIVLMPKLLEVINIDNMYSFVNTIITEDPDEYINAVVGDAFTEEDTYLDLGITVNEPAFLQGNIIENYRLRQEIENKILNEILKEGE